MGLKGARPKPPGQSITRHAQRHEWIEVPDVPNPNPPPLPPRRPEYSRIGVPVARKWPQGISEKWAKWAQMPHTVTWTINDWDYAIDSLHIAARAFETGEDIKYVAEMRIREKSMGTTHEARMGIRVRYVEPVETNEDIANLDDYRNLV